jgi:uncharacterized protein YigA (DUF484 family)
MSTVERAKSTVDETSEGAIADYLQKHPDFFERNSGLLTTLQLPHSTGGAAISLVERQVSVLRERHFKLERQLRDLVEVARGNDTLSGKIHALSMLLLDTTNRAEVVTILEAQLRIAFNADESVLVLFDDSADSSAESGHRFLRTVQRESPAIAAFKTFMQTGAARCGTVRDVQRNFLFGADNVDIGSVALVPLGVESGLGFLAIGSRNADHFNPGKSIDFLTRLGELVTCALQSRS